MDSSQREALRKSSRRNAVLSALGAALVIAALVYGGGNLWRLQDQTAALRNKVDVTEVTGRESRMEFETFTNSVLARERTVDGAQATIAIVTLGNGKYTAGDFVAALDAYDQALQQDPKDAYVLNLKGYALLAVDRPEDAVRAFERATSIRPDYGWGYFDLARAECASHQLATAGQSIRKALQLDPRLRNIMNADEEFSRLCAGALPR